MTATSFVVGLDLGQAADYTALAVLERSPGVAASEAARYAVRYLQRWPLRTPYTALVQEVTALLHRPPLREATTALLVDATGVGAAVVDLFKAAELGNLVAVTITAGSEAQEYDRGAWRVPKRDLVGVVQVLLQNQRLKVAAALPEAETLLRELEGFRVKISAAGNDSYGTWRDGTHDDLVLAVALAAWYGETQGVGPGFMWLNGEVVNTATFKVEPLPGDWLEPGVWP